MKIVLLLSILTTQIWAKTYHCPTIPFSDIDSLTIKVEAEKVTVEEETVFGTNIYTKSGPSAAILAEGIEISGWHGYTRTVSYQYNSIMLEHRDECGGGHSFLNCSVSE